MNDTSKSMSDHAAIFRNLHSLVGHWEGYNEDGHATAVNYSMTANDTALVEDWKFHNGMAALTIYHMDGNILMALHYCPIGNQPRLDLKRQLSDGTLEFECVSATHLKSFREPHEHSFDLKINEDGSIYRSETYVEPDGQLLSNAIEFRRVV